MEGGQLDPVHGLELHVRVAAGDDPVQELTYGRIGELEGVLVGELREGTRQASLRPAFVVASRLSRLSRLLIGSSLIGHDELGQGAAQMPGLRRTAELGQGAPSDGCLLGVSSHPVRDPGTFQGAGNGVETGVGAGQDGQVRPGAPWSVGAAQPSRHRGGLGVVVVEAVDHRARPVGARRLAGVGSEHRPRRSDDLGCGPVVVVEPQHGGAGQELGKSIEQGGVGTVPGVDGLAGVAHHEEIAVVPEPCLEQSPLGRVDVLELVDEEVPDPPPLGGRRGRGPLRGAGAARHEIVEVEHVAPRLLRDVGGVDLGDVEMGTAEHRVATRCPGRRRVVLGAEHAHLGPVDLAEHGGDLRRA